jgi:hypothetical protein
MGAPISMALLYSRRFRNSLLQALLEAVLKELDIFEEKMII